MSSNVKKAEDDKPEETQDTSSRTAKSKEKVKPVAGGKAQEETVGLSTGVSIEDAEKLKHWLTAVIEPLCDGDPEALAKYVLALIKKNRPEKELKNRMIDQLDVFLQEETKGFVNMLFRLLKSKEYLTGNPPTYNLRKEESVQKEEVKMDLSNVSPSSQESSTSTSNGSSTGSVTSPTTRNDPTASNKPCGSLPDKKPEKRNKRKRYKNSRSPATRCTVKSRQGINRKSPRKSRISNRKYHPRKMRQIGVSWNRRSSSPSRNHSRTPPRFRQHSRSRSRSPTNKRGRSRSATGISLLREKDEKKGASLPIKTPLDVNVCKTLTESKNLRDQPSVPSFIIKAGAQNKNTVQNSWCIDFHEKGLCMRGELCSFDHGSDAVVLEDVRMPVVSNAAGNVDFHRVLQASTYSASTPSVMRPAVATTGEYYPDSPAMNPISRWGNPIFQPVGINFDAPILNGMRTQGSLGSTVCAQRELINLSVMGGRNINTGSGNPHGPPPCKKMDNGMLHLPQPHGFRGMFSQGRGRGRGGFDHNRLGGFKPPGRNYYNCSLEVKNIPNENNNIMDLNSHFHKFGKIINILTQYENDPHAALVTFSTPEEFQAAYRSPEAVLNNRFIRVYWPNRDEGSRPSRSSVLERLEGQANDVKQEEKSGGNLTKSLHHTSALLGLKKLDTASEKVQAVEAIKKSQEMLAAQESLKKQEEQQKKEALKLLREIRQQKQSLMAEHIEQQKKIISKLESGKGTMKQDERERLMTLIKSMQNSIEQLKKDLDDVDAKALAALPTFKSNMEAQREILDAELELYNKEQEGEDTATLVNKVLNLRANHMETTYRGPMSFRGTFRGFRCRGRGSIRGSHQLRALRTVDRRPTKIQVTGFPAVRLPEILPHFSNFGVITEYETDNQTPSMKLKYETRKSAEVAMANGKMFGDTVLVIGWALDKNSISAPQISNNGETSQPEIDSDSVEEDDPELNFGDDEMEVGRSWRR